MKAIIEQIEMAYCWEGGARAKVLPSNNPLVVELSILGSSTVEHGGDVDGIRSQVHDLYGVTTTEDGFIYTVKSARCNLTEDERHDDSDYTVHVSGNVTLSKVKA